MPTAFDEQPIVRCALYGGAQINPRHGPSRPFSFATFKPDHDGGAIGGLFKSCGDNANDAWMPAFSRGPDQGPLNAAFCRLFQSQITHLRFDFTTLCIQFIQARRQGFGFMAVIRLQ